MGSNLNFKNFGNEQLGDGGGRQGSFGLVRQSSIYSLTFDEFQSAVGGGIGKDFGSMNMDELLKNIWSAEENQSMGSASGGQQQNSGPSGGYLQRQGSLTLPRTLSQKTVDEVWRDIMKEYCVEKDGSGGGGGGGGVGGSNMPQRQHTLGEMTLEEFLSKAGVVREETQMGGQVTNGGGVFSDLVSNSGLGFGYQQAGQNNNNAGLMGGRMPENNAEIGIQSANLMLNMSRARPSQPQLGTSQQQKVEQNHHHHHQQPLFPKQPPLAYGAPMPIPANGQLRSNGMKGGGVMGIPDTAINGNLVQGSALQGGGMGLVALGAGGGGVTVATGSPAVSSDGLTKSNGDTSSVSPAPYAFNGSVRGRKGSALEKVVERRQRRMIKNRESAARSRARKQAYTMELEAEVAKLKEENQELRKKQAEMMEMQKNQVLEMMNLQRGAKRRCLRRTQTSPW
ncbi:PREDICTED: ABSCISIC ACID-INSENSITIVE 5-like protein 5 isoform X2 [Ipomoea nil]|uniref:ABSCISIC ACID-INSENSITIVE 5-like protein 5 isoform X2 n=1 Tax=Ipomoea nil TaxID=35883 RepID=UPI000900A4DF|nr:PREDICTED: ABSCISIC ACID-INSENSITIVE 5-like protein 5 isoform X2 [Ipomoea nil]